MNISGASLVVAGLVSLFSAMPSSTNYQLNNYDYGSGGTSGSSSTNYSLNANTGQASGSEGSSTNYKLRSGNNNSQQANVPHAPTFTNPASYYNKLHFIVNPSDNPSDTKFSIAISDDNFTTTRYIQNDNTVGPNKGAEDYQSYGAWGGAGGQDVVGLEPNKTYKIKVNAIQGNFTETEYGPESTASTIPPSITFDIDVSDTDSETSAPYEIVFDKLYPGNVKNTLQKIWLDLDTNANSGAMIYIKSANTGLKSNYTGVTIPSATADLTVAGSGYGVQGVSATQTTGGPLSITSPYNGSGENVGGIDTWLRQVFSSPAPVTGGRSSLILKAKSTASTPFGSDYQDTLTIIVTGSF